MTKGRNDKGKDKKSVERKNKRKTKENTQKKSGWAWSRGSVGSAVGGVGGMVSTALKFALSALSAPVEYSYNGLTVHVFV